MSRDDFKRIFDKSLGANIWSLNSGLRCPKCGKKIRMSKIYYKNGVKKRYNNYRFVCTNKYNSHKIGYLKYTIDYLDMFEGLSRASESKCQLSNRAIE